MKTLTIKTLVILTAVISFGLTINYNPQSAAAKTHFSSLYTKNLKNCGSGWTKKEERAAENRGQDIPVECKGPGGYTLDISYSCCNAIFSVNRGKENISLFTESLNWKQENAEWRLADGKPFALIIRYNTYKFDEEKQQLGDVDGEFLLVKGLTGYENIDEKIDVRKTKNPNIKAVKIADAGYSADK